MNGGMAKIIETYSRNQLTEEGKETKRKKAKLPRKAAFFLAEFQSTSEGCGMGRIGNSSLRADGIRNWDLSLMKQFAIHESMTLQVRAEALNFTNTPRFAFPGVGWAPGPPGENGSTFGQVMAQANSPRRMQLGLRFQF